MKGNTVDLDAYFARIAYTGDRQPGLSVLRALQYQHVTTIPFENLDPLSGRPVRLDSWSLQEKLVHGQRGGYCFEHNLLFMHVLKALGFEVIGLAARVLWDLPAGVQLPRTHMLLGIDLNERFYLVDTGFGGLTLTAPLTLQPGVVQKTPHEHYRLQQQGEEFVLQVRLKDHWQSLYRFDLQVQQQQDYEMTSWYLSHHPQSRFVTNLIAARAGTDRRYTLHNGKFTQHRFDGDKHSRVLQSPGQLQAVLRDVFGIRLPGDKQLLSTLARFTVAEPEQA